MFYAHDYQIFHASTCILACNIFTRTDSRHTCHLRRLICFMNTIFKLTSPQEWSVSMCKRSLSCWATYAPFIWGSTRTRTYQLIRMLTDLLRVIYEYKPNMHYWTKNLSLLNHNLNNKPTASPTGGVWNHIRHGWSVLNRRDGTNPKIFQRMTQSKSSRRNR